MSATEQLALGLHLIIVETESFLHREPPTLNDWLDIAQLVVVWAGHVICKMHSNQAHLRADMSPFSFGRTLWLPPTDSVVKSFAIVLFVASLAISLAFVAYETTLPRKIDNPWHDGRMVRATFSGIHTNPIITSLIFVSFWAQLFEVNTPYCSLSTAGLAAQAFVLAAVGISWAFRLKFPGCYGHLNGQTVPLRTWATIWYQLVGWATVNNLLFALVQGALWCTMLRAHTGRAKMDQGAVLLGP
ncbi:hypothetical protein CLAFUW4_01966 [Fulvia fulva]|uniref:Uncharacterized protein n=1 Tax=Passalora fulva TaxID=5499 RepID=A0A9Q8L7K2_PASFU|nr:uncharacterized protein CLAFUR5_01960 [Fulvia fulva]KAK4634098.1 hypothetical protein CLAFUR4_01961 [Fulvia fulva]KAK4637580.1 hypothetical protein CLAFUR0_01963 [Fulvia fulva]UJO12381.1 hypothetical protein CLAFUR5_01960 [Fulvia fulva]WPV08540.1 hypothetical protein CLAFUW4_01966 [Fulvia fulva]WPV24861.1 hypothetical protein CLAFUW7_01965 [Fulvia fulva]